MNESLKKIIFDKLYEDLSHVEIIPYEDSIWFIDRQEEFWYLEFKKVGILYWRSPFFMNFFSLFSMERYEFEPFISEWVEEVLNCKVNTTIRCKHRNVTKVEEVLNCKVNTTICRSWRCKKRVEEVLNCKVNTTRLLIQKPAWLVEEVLNCKVNTTSFSSAENTFWMEEVLNCKVNTTEGFMYPRIGMVGKVINGKVNTI